MLISGINMGIANFGVKFFNVDTVVRDQEQIEEFIRNQ